MKTKKLSISMMLLIMFLSLFAQNKAQTAYISLDTLQTGDTIRLCTSQYSEVVLSKPTAALTNFHWEISQPINSDVFSSAITLNSTNSGPIWFSSQQTATVALHFFLIGPPVSPMMSDIASCGNIFAYTLNALNIHTGASYLWSTGETSQNIAIHHGDTYSVTISNGCGIPAHDTIVVTENHSNDAYLGEDQTICLHDSVLITTGNSNITSYAWSTGYPQSDSWISTTGEYTVTTTDINGCVSSDTVQLLVRFPYDAQELCMVFFDTISYRNKLIWDQTLNQGIDSIIIEKEVSLNTWQTIGAISNLTNTFIDINSTPQTNSDSYRIMVKDSCENNSSASNKHSTITLLTSYTPGTNVMGFTWSHYKVNDQLIAPIYTIYGLDANGDMQTIGSVTGSQNYFNWNTPNSTYTKFFVGFTLTCGTKTNYLVRSNYTQNPSGIQNYISELIRIYPTISDGSVYISTDLRIQGIAVYNSLGQLVLTTTDKTFLLSTHGLYVVHVMTPMGVKIQKIIVQ